MKLLKYFYRILICILFYSSIPISAKAKENKINICTKKKYVNLHPFESIRIKKITSKIYNSLITINDNKYKPYLAESWSVSEDKLTYKFTLKPNIYFYSTINTKLNLQVTADDVVASYQYLIDYFNKNFSSGDTSLKNKIFLKKLNTIKSITAIDNRNVLIQLKEPVNILEIAGDQKAAIMPAKHIKQEKNNLHYKPIGTGSFYIDKISYMKNITLRRKPDAFQNNIKDRDVDIDAINFILGQNNLKKINSIIQNYCHISKINRIASSNIVHNAKNNNTGLFIGEYQSTVALLINQNKSPTNDLEVRRRIRDAIDQTDIIKNIYLYNAKISNFFLQRDQSETVRLKPNNPKIKIKIRINNQMQYNQQELLEVISMIQDDLKKNNIDLVKAQKKEEAHLELINIRFAEKNYSWIYKYLNECSYKNSKCNIMQNKNIHQKTISEENKQYIKKTIQQTIPIVIIAEKPDVYIYNRKTITNIKKMIEYIY